jgi:hypothetical protein
VTGQAGTRGLSWGRGTVSWRALLVLLGGWSILPPYLGPAVGLELDVSSSVEVVDHVVPGAAIILCGGLSLLRVNRDAAEEESLLVLAATGVCILAALWQTVTHVPLLFDAGGSDAPWGAVLLHSTSGPLLLALSLWLLLHVPARETRRPRGTSP